MPIHHHHDQLHSAAHLTILLEVVFLHRVNGRTRSRRWLLVSYYNLDYYSTYCTYFETVQRTTASLPRSKNAPQVHRLIEYKHGCGWRFFAFFFTLNKLKYLFYSQLQYVVLLFSPPGQTLFLLLLPTQTCSAISTIVLWLCTVTAITSRYFYIISTFCRLLIRSQVYTFCQSQFQRNSGVLSLPIQVNLGQSSNYLVCTI